MTVLGLVAGVFTTACWLPQLVRTWRTRSTRDFSWLYLIVLLAGIAMWAVYGILRRDPAVIVANLVTMCLLLYLMVIKLGEAGRAPNSPEVPGSGR